MSRVEPCPRCGVEIVVTEALDLGCPSCGAGPRTLHSAALRRSDAR